MVRDEVRGSKSAATSTLTEAENEGLFTRVENIYKIFLKKITIALLEAMAAAVMAADQRHMLQSEQQCREEVEHASAFPRHTSAAAVMRLHMHVVAVVGVAVVAGQERFGQRQRIRRTLLVRGQARCTVTTHMGLAYAEEVREHLVLPC